jgi:hypothetical protein
VATPRSGRRYSEAGDGGESFAGRHGRALEAAAPPVAAPRRRWRELVLPPARDGGASHVAPRPRPPLLLTPSQRQRCAGGGSRASAKREGRGRQPWTCCGWSGSSKEEAAAPKRELTRMFLSTGISEGIGGAWPAGGHARGWSHRLKGPTGVGAVLAAELKLWKEP